MIGGMTRGSAAATATVLLANGLIAIGLIAIGLIAAHASGCSNGYVPPNDAGADASEDAGVNSGQDSGGTSDSGASPSDDAGSPGGDVNTGEDTGTGGSGEDTGPGGDGEDAGGENTCTPNRDGKVSRGEVVLKAGLRATFEVAHEVKVDTAGTMKDGGRYWDLAKSYEGDDPETIEFKSMDGKWFKPDYPDADYAMKLAGDSEELGVFDATPKGLYLLGVVSPEEGSFGETNIAYDPPVEVLKFPLEKGATWKTETTARGTHKTYSPAVPLSWDETYKNQVDATGTLKTPYGEFEVLRVRTVLERNQQFSGWTLGEVRTFAFVAECFGTVATIRSEDGEDETEFTEAAEVRRLTP